jgi:sialic acid synthase SpsE
LQTSRQCCHRRSRRQPQWGSGTGPAFDAARQAGADAVKFQTFARICRARAPTAQYQARETGEVDQFVLLPRLELSVQPHQPIKAHCDSIGIEFFSTPFSVDAVVLLVDWA